jgi:hypothetical protein
MPHLARITLVEANACRRDYASGRRAAQATGGPSQRRRRRGHEALILVAKIGFELNAKLAWRACKE